MMETDLHNSPRRFEKEKENISVFKNGKMAVASLEAMVTQESRSLVYRLLLGMSKLY